MSGLAYFDFYLLRSPIRPIESALELLALKSEEEIEAHLRELCSEQDIKEAIFLASPVLSLEVDKWLTGRHKPSAKLLQTLGKYAIRMGTRCTPYGAFAGVSMGKIVERAGQEPLCRNRTNMARYRLDMECLVKMARTIAADENIRSRLQYLTNSTLYKQGSQYKFYQQHPDGGHTHLAAVRSTPVLDTVLDRARAGATYKQLTAVIHEQAGTEKQANAFLGKLIANQLIFSELEPNVTGPDFFIGLQKKLRLLDEEQKYLPTLEQIGRLLDADKPVCEKNQQIQALLQQAFPTITCHNLLQGDLTIGIENNVLERRQMDRLTRQLNELIPLALKTPVADLDKFKQDFSSRYEGQMIPLLEALDPDTGVGYGTNPKAYLQGDEFLKDLDVPSQPDESNVPPHFYQDLVLQKYLDSIRHGDSEIVLTEADIENVEKARGTSPKIPPSCYAIGNLMAGAAHDGPLIALAGYGGASAGNLMTRFGYLDERLTAELKKVAAEEQECLPQSLAAEIVHLPEARVGNILQRPSLRKAEIILTGQGDGSSIPIMVHDLYLFMDGGDLVLWSKQQQKEIVPYLTSAHNFRHGITLYRFLADISSQHRHFHVQWDWGTLKRQPILPRVRYKNIILSRASWRIPKLSGRINNAADLAATMQATIEAYQLPNLVVLTEADNELLLDLTNPLCVSILMHKLQHDDVVLQECLSTQYPSPVRDSDGNHYANEIVIPLYSRCARTKTISTPPASHIRRYFPVGSEWVFAKIYCGPQTAENTLQQTIPRVIEALKDKKIVEKWFFIRYWDPSPHIRLRILCTSADNAAIAIRAVQDILAPELEEHTISNIQFDTYIREIERYGPQYIEFSETLFFCDSEFVSQIIQQKPLSTDRWMWGIIGIEHLLENFGYTLSGKQALAEKMRQLYAREFGDNPSYDKRFHQKFREKKHAIDAALSNVRQYTFLEARAAAAAKIASHLESTELSDKSKREMKEQLIASHIHMFVNRLFPYEQRLAEFTLYHILSSYYRMVIGRHKSVNPVSRAV